MKLTYVLYHANCPDGFAAAWVAKEKLGEKNATFIPVQYGQPLPEEVIEQCQMLYILDFSYPRDVLERLRDKMEILVIDHHKTAQEALKGYPYAIFDMERSGAVLTWKYFFGEQPMPTLLGYIEDRDLWRFNLPGSKPLSYGLRSYPYDFKVWDELISEYQINRLINEGQGIVRFIDSECERIGRHARLINIGNYSVPACTGSSFFSELAEWLVQHTDAPFAAVWFQRQDGEFVYSLRSRGDVDVSEIAKKYGGGGHKNAAGFQSKTMLG